MKIVLHLETGEPELLGEYVDTDPESSAITYTGTDGRWSSVPGDVGLIVEVVDPRITNCLGCAEGEPPHAIDCPVGASRS